MTNRKTTRRALVLSILSLLVCCSMLVGTTFAWFTDSVTSGNNKIIAGNLDVELYYANTPNGTYSTVVGVGDVFVAPTGATKGLWEPGHTEVAYLKIVNEGTLALKYQLRVSPYTEVVGKNEKGEDIKLSEILKFVATEPTNDPIATAYTRQTAQEAALKGDGTALTEYTTNVLTLGPKEERYVALVVYMPEEVGNEANYRGNVVPSIEFALDLQATQVEAENDSFDNKYDEDAWANAMVVMNEADLNAAIAAGGKVMLGADVTLTKAVEIPAGVTIALNMNGHKITSPDYIFENQGNLTIDGNGTFEGLGVIRSKAGKITINSGNFYASSKWQNNAYQHTLKAENTDVVINGGEFDATVNGQTNAMLSAAENGTITINGGSFKNVAGELGDFDPYIFTYEKNGKLIINDGTFYGGWRFNGETATTDIYGGDFTVGLDGQSFNANSTHVLTVYGGTFTEGTKLAGKLGDVVATNCVAVDNGDGTITVLPKIDGVTISKDSITGLYWNGNSANHKSVYYLYNASDLEKAADYFVNQNHTSEANKVTFELMGDVDMAGQTWTPWSVMWLNFNGNRHTISNLTTAAGWRGGFFGYIGASTISDLTLENVTANGAQAGTFAGSVEGVTFTDCVLKGDNTVNYVPYTSESHTETWGGIGAVTGVVANCTINVEIASGTTVALNYGAMTTEAPYVDELTGYISTNQGVVTNNGTITTVKLAKADNDAELIAAIKEHATEIELAAGEYEMPNGIDVNLQGKTLTIKGGRDVVIDASKIDARDQFVIGTTLEFEGVTLNFGKVNYMGFANTKSLTYKDCAINGLQFLFGENVTFEGCDLNSNGAEHAVWTYGAKNISFSDCDFIYGDRGINCYSDNDITGGKQTVNFTNCTFTTANAASDGAVEINSCFFSVGIEVNLTGGTAPAYGQLAYVSPWDSTNGAKTTINIQ